MAMSDGVVPVAGTAPAKHTIRMPFAFHLPRLLDIKRAATSSASSAFKTWPIVAFGFGTMLCLGLMVTVITLNSIKNMRESVLRLTDANQSRREHVDALRTQMYVSSILIRDYLLDNSPERLASYKASLRNNHEAAVGHLKELSRLSSPESHSTLSLLAGEVQAYWLSLDSLMPVTDQRPANAYEHVRTHIIPRRQAVISLAEELADLNRSEEHTSELQSQSNLVCRLLL